MVTADNVFKVCDEPHPMLVKDMLDRCLAGNFAEAHKILHHLWRLGYAAEDIISMIFRMAKNHNMDEFCRLEFLKVSYLLMRFLLF